MRQVERYLLNLGVGVVGMCFSIVFSRQCFPGQIEHLLVDPQEGNDLPLV